MQCDLSWAEKNSSKKGYIIQETGAWHWFWLHFSHKILKVSLGGELEIWHWKLHRSLNLGFPVEIRGPVHQVEGPKEHWENYPGHLVDLAHTVVSLFGVRSLSLGWLQLHGCAVWNGGNGRVLGQVSGVVDPGGTGVVGLLGQSQRVFLLHGRHRHHWEEKQQTLASFPESPRCVFWTFFTFWQFATRHYSSTKRRKKKKKKN